MGCCGCSLYTSTITAAIFTLIDCVLFLTFDIFIIIFITSTNSLNWFNDPKFKPSFNDIDTTSEVLIGLRIALRFIWLISALAMFQGNAKEYRKFLYVWELLTVTRIIFAIATSIYALVKLMEDVTHLFNADTKWENARKELAEFVIFIEFLELGPIWLIILIALIIFVHQRALEIERNKNQMTRANNWGSANHNDMNGHSNITFSKLAHPLSLTQPPNPLKLSKIDENFSSKVSTTSSVEPIYEINDVITIPRVRTLIPPKDYNQTSIAQSFETKKIVRKTSNASALAKRSSYLFNDSGRDLSKLPQRNHSYNYGQRPQSKNAYDNRAYQRSNNDLSNPFSIKRASLQKY